MSPTEADMCVCFGEGGGSVCLSVCLLRLKDKAFLHFQPGGSNAGQDDKGWTPHTIGLSDWGSLLCLQISGHNLLSCLSPGLLLMQQFFSWPQQWRLAQGWFPLLWLASDPVTTRQGKQTAFIRFLSRKFSYQCKWVGIQVRAQAWRCFLTKRFFCTLERKHGWKVYFCVVLLLLFDWLFSFWRTHRLKKQTNKNFAQYHFARSLLYFCPNCSETHRRILEVWKSQIFGSVSKKTWMIPKHNIFDKRTREKTISIYDSLVLLTLLMLNFCRYQVLLYFEVNPPN